MSGMNRDGLIYGHLSNPNDPELQRKEIETTRNYMQNVVNAFLLEHPQSSRDEILKHLASTYNPDGNNNLWPHYLVNIASEIVESLGSTDTNTNPDASVPEDES